MTADQKSVYFPPLFPPPLKSQFTHWLLIRMFCKKRFLPRINNIYERSLSLIRQNYISEFERLLDNENEKSVYQECIWFLLIEVYKYLNGLSADIMNTIFKLKQNTYNLRSFHAFESQNLSSKNFRLDRIAYRAARLWKNDNKERNSVSLSLFKESIKKVPLFSCFKTYIHQVGYI